VARLSLEKERQFRELALATSLVPVDGLVDLLERIEAQGLAKALVTNAPRLVRPRCVCTGADHRHGCNAAHRENVDAMLEAAGLARFFPRSLQVAAGGRSPFPPGTACVMKHLSNRCWATSARGPNRPRTRI
jgi:beta-phosphoglucomutase-like phosphatase (HAD superfamily)